MPFFKPLIPILAAGLVLCAATTGAVHAFSIKNQVQATGEVDEVSNKEFERAAFLEAKAYICGTDEPSEAAMRAGMRQTGLPEDVAVEIVSDLASGIVDKAAQNSSKEICGKAEVRLSNF